MVKKVKRTTSSPLVTKVPPLVATKVVSLKFPINRKQVTEATETFLNTLTAHPKRPAQRNAKTKWETYRMTALNIKVTVMDKNTVNTIEKVPLAPTRVVQAKLELPNTPIKVNVASFFNSLNITEIAAEAGKFNAPKTLRRTILDVMIVKKTYTILLNAKSEGRKTLPWVTLTTLPSAAVLIKILTVVTTRTAPNCVIPVLTVEFKKPMVLPSIFINKLKAERINRNTITFKQINLTRPTPQQCNKDNYPRHLCTTPSQ